MCVVRNNLLNLWTDHRRVLAGLRMVKVVQVVHHSREFFLSLFVQVRNSDTGSEYGKVRVSSGH